MTIPGRQGGPGSPRRRRAAPCLLAAFLLLGGPAQALSEFGPDDGPPAGEADTRSSSLNVRALEVYVRNLRHHGATEDQLTRAEDLLSYAIESTVKESPPEPRSVAVIFGAMLVIMDHDASANALEQTYAFYEVLQTGRRTPAIVVKAFRLMGPDGPRAERAFRCLRKARVVGADPPSWVGRGC